jgi:hypothetical protein
MPLEPSCAVLLEVFASLILSFGMAPSSTKNLYSGHAFGLA